jgi:hypothetical protein
MFRLCLRDSSAENRSSPAPDQHGGTLGKRCACCDDIIEEQHIFPRYFPPIGSVHAAHIAGPLLSAQKMLNPVGLCLAKAWGAWQTHCFRKLSRNQFRLVISPFLLPLI